MANEFIIRKGYKSLSDSEVSGSLLITGSVGIGVPSPAHILDISGSSSAIINVEGAGGTSTETKIYLYNKEDGSGHTGGVASLRSYGWGTAELRLGSNYLRQSGGDFRLDSSNQDIIFQPGSGKVGIDTTSPGEKLEVVGSVKIGNLKIQNATSGRIGFNRNTATGTIYDSNNGAYQLQHNNVGYLELQSYNSSGVFQDHLVFTEAGSLGIGTSAPTKKLHVDGEISGSDVFINDWGSVSASLATIVGNDLDGSGTANDIAMWSDSDTLTDAPIAISGNDAIFAGNIQIGKAAPILYLHDNNNAGGGGAEARIVFKNTDGNAMFIGYTADVTSTSDLLITNNAPSTYGGYGGLDVAAIDDPANIILDAKTNVLLAPESGSVGIGTTAPLAELHVIGDISGSGTLDAGGISAEAATGTFTFTGDPVLYGNLNYGEIPAQANAGVADSGIATEFPSSEAVRIDSSGNVGIGTTDPAGTLDVIGPVILSGDTEHYIEKDTTSLITAAAVETTTVSGRNVDLYAYDDINFRAGTGDKITMHAGGSERVRINSSGYVGIGTTDPSASLDVNGIGYFRGGTPMDFGGGDTFTDVGLIIEENDFIYTKDSVNLRKLIGKTNTDIIQIGQSGTSLIDEIRLMPGTTNGIVSFYNDNSEYARFQGGNLAVGSTSTYGRVQISGGSTAPDLSATTATNISLVISNSDTGYGTMFATYGSGIGALQQRRTNTNTYYDFLLQPHGGRVGIGTTSPTEALDVSGTVKADSLLITPGGNSGDYLEKFVWAHGNSSSDGTTWRKVCDVDIPTGLYAALSMDIVYYYPSSNYGNSASLKKWIYSASFRRSHNVQDDLDDAILYGNDADRVRIVKTATGAYELQARVINSNQRCIIEYSVTANNSSWITPTTSIVSGATTGTTYTASEDTSMEINTGGLLTAKKLNIHGEISGSDVFIDDWGSVSASLSSIQQAGGVNGGGASTRVAYWSDGDTLTSDADFTFSSNTLGLTNTATNGKSINVTDGTSWLGIVPTLGSGGFTGLSAAGDIGLIFSIDNDNTTDSTTNGLLIAPHTQTSGGLKILENGYVGIGTGSPNYHLEVNGAAQVKDYIRITNTGGAQKILFGNQDSSGVNNPSMIIGANGTTYIGGGSSWSGNGGTIDYTATFTNGGSVGIGTTSPTGKFNSYISATRQLTHNGNGGDLSVISDNNSTPVFYVKGTGTADLVNVFDNTTEVFTILDGGNVGIGTDAPNTHLHIYEPAASSTATTDMLKLQAYTADFGATPAAIALAFKFQDSNNSTNEARIRMATVNDTDYGDNDEAASNLIFSTTDGGTESDKMIITGRGAVGIGTVNPSNTLHIVGGNANQLLLENGTSSGTSKILFKANSLRDAGPFIQATQRGGASSDSDLQLGDESGTILTLNAGSVGIGTTSPNYTLDVEGSSNGSDGIQITNTNTGTAARANLELVSDSAQLDIYATAAAYNGVTGWADAGVLSTSSGTSGGLILNSQAGGINFQIGTVDKVLVEAEGLSIVRETSPPQLTFHHGGVDLGTNELITQINFTADYQGSSIPYARIDVDTNASGVRADMDFVVKSTSGTLETALKLQGGSAKPKAFFYNDLDVDGVLFADSVRVTNIVTNKIVKFDGTDLDDSLLTDDGSTVTVGGNFTVDGILTAQEFRTEYITSSVIFESGSTQFGNSADDVHTFTGSLNLDGTLTATVKSFDIVHPTQEGKRLVYGVLEGPEHAVYVRGESTVDTVILPEEWTGLVDESTLTVQLTPIGSPDIYYYKGYEDNSIKVGGPEQMNYFYYVQATRKDVEPLITVQ